MRGKEIERIETYAYERNRRYEVKKGTRCSLVALNIGFRSPRNLQNTSVRSVATGIAIDRAARAWEEEWGAIPWDDAQVLATHTTTQVIVELRVGWSG